MGSSLQPSSPAVSKATSSSTIFTAEQYFLEDYRHTLFPLSTTKLLVEKFSNDLRDYVKAGNPFRSQSRCSAAKRGFHLRRTVKLDPPSEFFVYDLVFRNRKCFRADHNPTRSSFGFLFKNGKPISSKIAYQQYRAAISEAKSHYKFGMRFDIASYFNSLYHHDLVSRFREIGAAEDDVDLYGRFLREINSGRSLDCLPHGIHPCKVLGADYLKFIDNSVRLRSQRVIRFLDDFNVFAESEKAIQSDFVLIQELLSERGLFLNEGKTLLASNFGRSMTEEIDDLKAQLLRARRELVDASGIELGDQFLDEDDDESSDDDNVTDEELAEAMKRFPVEDVTNEIEDSTALTQEQTKYLLDLLNNSDIDESDAELALVLLRDHGNDVLEHMGDLLTKFPGLIRTIYQFSSYIDDKSELCSLVLRFLRGEHFVTEYQLFWITKMLEDQLSAAPCYGTALALLDGHPSSTPITRAKLLEIPEMRFGLPELRELAVRSGQCDWPAWAAAMGSRVEKPANRNHLLGYFKNGGPMNQLIGQCVINL